MYLKRLKVRNFKSFAGAVEIPFRPGFTGVAGPNGMGKSNISDAILFVLGPTSSKALRAERLTQLFFNGGSTKKAATECEVSLEFDNRDRILPVEGDEVEVTRYVKLAPSDPDGYYSYFYVNGRRTTQGEIDSMLAHARLSGDGYNLVQQGDVNRIVSMGPVPRRTLVERLAGISQYDDELGRASSKKQELDANLTQIHTLLSEVRAHLGALESQRLQAIQYRELETQKRRAEAQLAQTELLRARQEVNAGEALGDRLQREVQELEVETTRLEGERDAVAHRLDEAEQEIAQRAGPEAIRFKTELDAARLNFARLEEKLRTGREDLTELAGRIETLGSVIAADRKEESRLGKSEADLSGKLASQEQEVHGLADSLQSLTGGAEQSHGKLVEARRSILEAEKRQQAHGKAWEANVQKLEAARAQAAANERELAQAEDDERTRELELKDVELHLREIKDAGSARSSAERTQELLKLRAREKSVTESSQRLAEELLEINRRYMALDARLKARVDGGSKGGSLAAVDYLLSLRNLGKVAGIRGTVEELGEYAPEHRTALTVAAGNRFQALVVESDQVAEQCIQLLRSEKRGRATFLPLNRMLAGRPRGKALLAAQSPGSAGFALDLVKFDEALRPAFWFVFGETVVMPDLARAREQMGGVRLVTLQGDLIEATGAMTGGYLDTSDRGRGLDSAVELKRLGVELQEKSAEESAARAELTRLETEIRKLSETLAQQSGEARAHEETRVGLQTQLGPAREKLAAARQRIEEAHGAHERSLHDVAEAERRAKELEEEKGRLTSELEHLNSEYMDRLPGAISGKIRSLQEAHATAVSGQMALARELEGARAKLAALRTALEEKSRELTFVRDSHERRDEEVEELGHQHAEAKAELEKLRTLEDSQSQATAGLLAQKHQVEEERVRLVETLARSQETLRTRRAMRENEAIRLVTAQQRLAELEAAAKEFEGVEEEAGPAVPPDELRRLVQSIASQLQTLGSVNLRALEEYDAEKQRVDHFEVEVQRIGSERTELESLVEEIETKKKERLLTVVAGVNEGYRGIYQELSGGGEGDIALENPADPLAGGLLIRARPVGKNVQRLEQLSGGEKSLASLAFIFALQRFDPSPLYVFDEVDMSLDGVNAENVGRMLRRNAERAQFIVISLRKVTLRCAHQLFGVTMRGDGCSRVVGLHLDEIVDVDERERPEPIAAPAPEAAA